MPSTTAAGRPVADSLKKIRVSRNLQREDVARALEMNIKTLGSLEDGTKEASRGEINSLAKFYAVPTYFFYTKQFPEIKNPLPDFRDTKIGPVKLHSALAVSFSNATEIRDIIAEGMEFVREGSLGKEQVPSLKSDMSRFEAASAMREFFQLDDKPASGFADTKQYIDWLRTKLERAGVVSVYESYDTKFGRGYCLADDNFVPYVVLNTYRQINESRVFTLIHEAVHVALRRSGISDPFATRNQLETFCNRVAAATLMPKSLFVQAAKDISPNATANAFVRNLAEKFKVSQQATALRAEQVEVKPEGFYRTWVAQFKKPWDEQINDKKSELIRRSGDQGKMKLSYYGTTLPLIFHDLVDRRFISALDVYRISGLKPKFQDKTYSAAVQRIQELGLNAG